MIKKIFSFFASLKFALILFFLSALVVAIGTIIESYSNSHELASELTYAHPLFQLILLGFFINILYSALKRWPFKIRHIPFLITHLGLLMIISGTIYKNFFGLQGYLILRSGSETSKVIFPHSLALSVEKKNEKPISYPLKSSFLNQIQKEIDSPNKSYTIESIALFPNSEAHVASWIKDEKLFINGLNPMPVKKWDPSQLTPALKLEVSKSHPLIDLYALSTDDLNETLFHLFVNEMQIQIEFTNENNLAINGIDFFKNGLKIDSQHIQGNIIFDENPKIIIDQVYKTKDPIQLTLPLSGGNVFQLLPKHVGKGSLKHFTMKKNPLIAFIQDADHRTHFLAINGSGKIFFRIFDEELKGSLFAYHQGFQGYGLNVEVPKGFFYENEKVLFDCRLDCLFSKLTPLLESTERLSLPLSLMKESALKINADFAASFITFLELLEKENQFLYPASNPLPKELEALFNEMNLSSLPKESLMLFLLVQNLSKDEKAPPFAFLSPFSKLWENSPNLIEEMKSQALSFISNFKGQHQNFESPKSPGEKAAFFSLILRIFSLDLESLEPSFETEALQNYEKKQRFGKKILKDFTWIKNLDPLQQKKSLLELFQNEKTSLKLKKIWKTIYKSDPDTEDYIKNLPFKLNTNKYPFIEEINFETMLKPYFKPIDPELKREDNKPLYLLNFKEKGKKPYQMALNFDPTRADLKWPSPDGEYLFRLEKEEALLPLSIRLKEAGQKMHAGSSNAFSYECRIQVKEPHLAPSNYCLSMNKVFETKGGLRFYLSSITPADETDVQTVQFAVNHDPLKYILTYPGGLLVALGGLLLFTRKLSF